MAPLPAGDMSGEFAIRGGSAPAQFNVFANGNGAFGYTFGTNGLFANIELTALNEKLGSYFGATEGVLVVNIGTRRAFGDFSAAVPFMTRDVVIRRHMDSTVRAAPRAGAVARSRVDTMATTIDGVPVQPGIPLGLEPGDVILSVDGRKVTSPSQLMRIVGSYDHNDEFKLQIIRQKRPETLTIKMP